MRFATSGRLWINDDGQLFMANPPVRKNDGDPINYDDRDHEHLGHVEDGWYIVPDADRRDYRILLDQWQDSIRYAEGIRQDTDFAWYNR